MASFDVKIKSTTGGGEMITVSTSAEMTILQLKEVISGKTDAPSGEQRLIYKGQVLKDDRTVDNYGIKKDHVLHMVRSNRQTSSTSATSTPVSAAAPSPSPTSTGLPTGGAEDPMAAMQRSMMSSLAANPEALRSMIQSNPALQQIMNSNPEVSHVLNNPQLLRETMNLAANPSLMREQMRHTDRAMSNLEAHPEGFNALRRMYETFQEPLANAASGASPNEASSNENSRSETGNAAQTNSTGGNASATGVSSSPNTAPLPNPWAPAGAGGNRQNADATANRLAGLGLGGPNLFGSNPMGGGMEGLGNMGNMDPSSVMQQMSDPNFRNAMSSFLGSDLGQQLITSAAQNNPQLRSMMDQNPAMREVMNNPETLRRMFSPEGMAAMSQMQQMMGGGGMGGLGTQQPGLGAAGQPGLAQLLNMGGMGGFGAPQPVANPEETYSSQITQLQEMGFYDRESNIRALQATGGNVQAAVDRLLSQF